MEEIVLKLGCEGTEKQMAFDLHCHLIQEKKYRGQWLGNSVLFCLFVKSHIAFIFNDVLEVLT